VHYSRVVAKADVNIVSAVCGYQPDGRPPGTSWRLYRGDRGCAVSFVWFADKPLKISAQIARQFTRCRGPAA
jgi:hypothetical protein